MVTVCESLGWATAGEFSGVALLLVYMLFDVGSLHLHISILLSKLVFYSISAEMSVFFFQGASYISRCFYCFVHVITRSPFSMLRSVLQLKAFDGYCERLGWASAGDVFWG